MASIIRLVYGTIDRVSRDATFDLTRVGVCTCVCLPILSSGPWSVIRKSKSVWLFLRAGELAAGILVGNLVVSPRFFTTYGPKVKSLFSSDGSDGQSSGFFHYVNPKTSGLQEKQGGARLSTSWLDRHSASKIPETTWQSRTRQSKRKDFIYLLTSCVELLFNFRLEISISDNILVRKDNTVMLWPVYYLSWKPSFTTLFSCFLTTSNPS